MININYKNSNRNNNWLNNNSNNNITLIILTISNIILMVLHVIQINSHINIWIYKITHKYTIK